MNGVRRWLGMVTFLLVASTAIAESGIAARDLDLRAEPRNDARVVGKLIKDAKFEVLKHQKPWAQVSTGEQQGWVLFFYLGWAEAPAPAPVSSRNFSSIFSFGAQRQQTTAVLGIRGLDEEELKSARFNADEMNRLESFAVNSGTAGEFAREGQLAPRRLDYPKESSTSVTNPGVGQ